MGRSYCLAICVVFCTATTGLAQSACCGNALTRSTYANTAAPAYPTVLTYYQPGAIPSVQPQPIFCGQCAAPQVVQAVPAPRPVVTYRPLLPLAPAPESYYTGQGVLGQPKLYVPGQPIRNFLRYLGP
jgi:hypothetical protein